MNIPGIGLKPLKLFACVFFLFYNGCNQNTQTAPVIETEPITDIENYQTKTELRLPFNGEWYVYWGGRTIEDNYHRSARDQKYAYDFVIRKNGVGYSDSRYVNENHYCFGERLLAPGNGIVVAALNSVEDNTPVGVLNQEQPAGNYVILDHGNGEFSILAHFKKGSIVVKVGDYVGRSELLGLCGNSGRSYEPHLHYHLQNTPRLFDGDGLPAQFQGYRADGNDVDRGEPTCGQYVEHQGN